MVIKSNKWEKTKKFAVVSGASTGIGRAIALELAKDGFLIANIGRRKDKLKETLNQIRDEGGDGKIFLKLI